MTMTHLIVKGWMTSLDTVLDDFVTDVFQSGFGYTLAWYIQTNLGPQVFGMNKLNDLFILVKLALDQLMLLDLFQDMFQEQVS